MTRVSEAGRPDNTSLHSWIKPSARSRDAGSTPAKLDRAIIRIWRLISPLALFDLGIDSKLRACDLVKLRVRDVSHGDQVAARAMVLQQKTQRPVQFEITPTTREALEAWIKSAGLKGTASCFLAGCTRHHILALGSTPGSCMTGSRKSVSIPPRTGRTPCAERSRR